MWLHYSELLRNSHLYIIVYGQGSFYYPILAQPVVGSEYV